jgi:hypothetical protein
MEKKRSNFAGRFRHENARVRLVAHQYRERSDVILMRMSDENCVDCLALDRLPIWERILTRIFGMHPAIENQPPASRLKIVGVRADLRMSGEIDELHAGGRAFYSKSCSYSYLKIGIRIGLRVRIRVRQEGRSFATLACNLLFNQRADFVAESGLG